MASVAGLVHLATQKDQMTNLAKITVALALGTMILTGAQRSDDNDRVSPMVLQRNGRQRRDKDQGDEDRGMARSVR